MAEHTFRSAFNGFNREDVIHHLEYVNTRHANELNQLKQENDVLQAQIDMLLSRAGDDQAAAAAEESMAAMEAENNALRRQIEALTAQLAETQPAAAAEPAACTDTELELYRRAERVEREARERAAQACRDTNTALTGAAAKVDEAAAQIDEMADRVHCQLEELQAMVSNSKTMLHEAAAIIGALHTEV